MSEITVKEYTDRIVENCSKVIVGKDEVIRQIIVCFLAGGHVLLEDIPGTGKTMLLRAFAKSMGSDFKRIQFTPDLLPSDLTGINFYNQKESIFEFRKGPLFTNMILADEINRATPRTQAALLESMEEKQISVDGQTYKMAEPFMVMATQNPLESYGTFPLPDAQVDRFFMKLSLGYMSREQELMVLTRPSSQEIIEKLKCVITDDETKNAKAEIKNISVSNDVTNYIMDIVEATRNDKNLTRGVSTRGALALYKAAQITAAMKGRNYCIPEDVKAEVIPVLGHRLTVQTGSHKDTSDYLLNLVAQIKVPLEDL